ncbi:hypothetical protein MIND_00586400 [Mycena indigotica]|uniref:Uncharacterized protein n=1 Tax=Mycena indigotica TaxID=2126181 RepID=A0A8H6W5H2_9AGAR|nr:uncharacterized protein MIND_00586400 [Mycena indigotica]KAF7303571.1 hypothetical protein MIND_00586400 [Mycena indigotica]
MSSNARRMISGSTEDPHSLLPAPSRPQVDTAVLLNLRSHSVVRQLGSGDLLPGNVEREFEKAFSRFEQVNAIIEWSAASIARIDQRKLSIDLGRRRNGQCLFKKVVHWHLRSRESFLDEYSAFVDVVVNGGCTGTSLLLKWRTNGVQNGQEALFREVLCNLGHKGTRLS